MSADRKIIINVLPQSPEAWENIALVALFASAAFAFSSMAGCVARSDEARARAAESVKITGNTVINAK